ncbi:hypothetical protein GA0115255_101303 [Streptomyces sp. Ncost-T6T-2b]|nr:hypothetical protein GA0115255_101303 [Streptomyces sp. Ncost-T6T-2b]
MERGRNPAGSAFGTTSMRGAVAPSVSANQSRVRSLSTARASSRAAWRSNGSPLVPRSSETRCSWWTVMTSAGASCTASAMRAGVVVIRMSVSVCSSARPSSMSESRLNAASQARSTRLLGCWARAAYTDSSRPVRRTGRCVRPVMSTR